MRKGESMSEKGYHEIMTEITAGLTGNTAEDMKYLAEKGQEYKTHKMAKEILRGIGRLMYEIIPEDSKEELNQALKNNSLGWQTTLEEVDFCIYKKEFYKARTLIESLIEKLEEVNMFADDAVSIYKDFRETFEEVLYMYRNRPEKDLRAPGFPYASIYTKYGSLLFELGEHEKAKEALRKAMKWNPVNAEIAFELAENYKVTGDLEMFYEITKSAYENCFRPRILARYYRNLAFYYSEKKRFREATACILVSGSYDNTSANLQSELYYIQEMNGGTRINLSSQDIKEILETEGISSTADQDILGLSYSIAKDAVEKKEWQGAEYFLEIFFGLTDDEETARILESIKKIAHEAS